jgi:4-alpha-glucanotransferase
MELFPALRRLAEIYGIATEFWDWQGRHVDVPAETVIAVLAALDVDAGTPEAAAQAVAEREAAPWRRMLPSSLVIRAGWAPTVNVHVRHGEPVSVWIDLEAGGVRSGLHQHENYSAPREIDGALIGQATFQVPGDLPLGYHTLRAWSAGDEASMALIVTPAWVGFPDRMGDRPVWGIATQLYSVRSAQSWGVGDVGDLEDLAVWGGAQLGAGFVLVNPLHAAEPAAPMEPSPYLPTTRRFQNPLYLRVERIPEFADLDDAARRIVAALRAGVHRELDDLDRIDRDIAWAAKRKALALVHAVPRSIGRDLSYRAYRTREGRGLDDYATWCALFEVHGPDWHDWPAELQHPDLPAVVAFRGEHADAVDFHRWLQWVLDEQLGTTQAAAVRAGMSLGVMHDLAVGVHPEGSDSWALQDVFARGMTVGAPPDAFNQNGQDWAQPPWRPDRLAEQAYAPFRDMVSTVLRSAGGVRVDHIIGLFRLWWIPAGHGPTEGTYLRYDHEALVGILALEAHRARALVVGEDLGTVEPWVRDYLRERGILGTSILWFEFEFDGSGAPLRPEWWREYCLASVTTHDLPPTAGYLAGDHVRLRDSLGLLTRELEEELAADEAERGSWLEELRRRGALGSETVDAAQAGLDPDAADATDAQVQATVLALHRYLTWTPSRLISVALSDLVGDRRTQNQPGTVDEYPNWRVPLTGPDGALLPLEEVVVSRRARLLAEVVGDR